MLPTMTLAHASCEHCRQLGICSGRRELPYTGRSRGELEGNFKGGLTGGLKGWLKGGSVLGAAVGDAADGQPAVEAVLQVACGPHRLPQSLLLARTSLQTSRIACRISCQKPCTLKDSRLCCPGPQHTEQAEPPQGWDAAGCVRQHTAVGSASGESEARLRLLNLRNTAMANMHLIGDILPGAAHEHGCLVRRGGDGCDAVAWEFHNNRVRMRDD